MVIPVGMGFLDYALEVQKIFKKEKMFADVDTTGNTLPKKIRNAQLAQYNFIFGMSTPSVHLFNTNSSSLRNL